MKSELNQPNDTGSLYERTCAKIEEFLSSHGHVDLEKSDGWIWVRTKKQGEFDVGLSDEGDEVIVHAHYYHEHHTDSENAAAAFMWLLTPSYRVVGTYRGNTLVHSSLERMEKDGFVQIGTVRSVFPSFGKKRIEIFQNHIIDG